VFVRSRSRFTKSFAEPFAALERHKAASEYRRSNTSRDENVAMPGRLQYFVEKCRRQSQALLGIGRSRGTTDLAGYARGLLLGDPRLLAAGDVYNSDYGTVKAMGYRFQVAVTIFVRTNLFFEVFDGVERFESSSTSTRKVSRPVGSPSLAGLYATCKGNV
jgi:hypothetical protein